MTFNRHSSLEGQHAFLGASKYHWINYDEPKVREAYDKYMKDNEVYAPYLENGETVALVRFPHAGTFEIPILKVNNKNPDAIAMMGKTPKDAVGINSKVAEQLSGADFDGDTVMVIPCNSSKSNVRITSSRQLEGLKDFDPKMTYPERKGMKYMTKTKTALSPKRENGG